MSTELVAAMVVFTKFCVTAWLFDMAAEFELVLLKLLFLESADALEDIDFNDMILRNLSIQI